MNALNDQLMTLSALRASGIWAEGHEPTIRTLQSWAQESLIPWISHGRRRLVVLAGIAKRLRVCLLWPNNVLQPPELVNPDITALRLVRFHGLRSSGIWHLSALPCERVLRAMVERRQIPCYQISRMQFFCIGQVRHCLVDSRYVEAA